MSDKYSSLKVKELKDLIKKRDLSGDGKKDDLVNILVKADELDELEKLEEELGLGEIDSTKVNLDLDEEEILKPIALDSQIVTESVLSDDDDIDVDLALEPIKRGTKQNSKNIESKKEEIKKSATFNKIMSENVLSDDELDLFDSIPENNSQNSKAVVTSNDQDKKKKQEEKKVAKVEKKQMVEVKKVVDVEDKQNEDENKKKFVFNPIVYDKEKRDLAAANGKKAEKKAQAERAKAEEEKRLKRMKRFATGENSEEASSSPEVSKAKDESTQKTENKSKTITTTTTTIIQQDVLQKRAERFGLSVKKAQDVPEAKNVTTNKGKPSQKNQNTQQRSKKQQVNNTNNNNNNNKRFNNSQKPNNTRSVINQVNNGRVIKHLNPGNGNKHVAGEIISRHRNQNQYQQQQKNNNINGQTHNIGDRSVTIGVPVAAVQNKRYQSRQQPQRLPQKQQPHGQKRHIQQQPNNSKKRKY